MRDPVALVLPRLDNVRQFGNGWRADCPIGHKSRGALAVTIGDGGNMRLHCFAGCEPLAVLQSVGLTLADLFTVRLKPQTPEERRAARQAGAQASWAAALGVLARESTIVEITAATILRGELLAPDDVERVRVASQRIHDCRQVLHGN